MSTHLLIAVITRRTPAPSMPSLGSKGGCATTAIFNQLTPSRETPHALLINQTRSHSASLFIDGKKSPLSGRPLSGKNSQRPSMRQKLCMNQLPPFTYQTTMQGVCLWQGR